MAEKIALVNIWLSYRERLRECFWMHSVAMQALFPLLALSI